MEQDTQWLYQLLAEVQLEKFYLRVRDGLNITRVEHFAYVKEADLEHVGISKPAQRRLWDALKRHKASRGWRSWVPKGFGGRGPDAAVGEPGSEGGRPALPSLIQDSELILGERLGSGSFGVVKKGEWHTPTGRVVRKNATDFRFRVEMSHRVLPLGHHRQYLSSQLPVAVKSLRSSMSRQAETLTDFLQEVTSMQSLDHPHIIRLYGVVLTHPLKMVTELAQFGSLYDTLRSRQFEYPLTRLWLFAGQIAAGMDYLETRRFIHRDLAARNVLLASRETVKLADFGLMRGLSRDADHYVMSAHRRIPFAWSDPLRLASAAALGSSVSVSQVRPGKSPRGLFLAFLRRVDVRRHPLGDVHLLRRALARSLGKTGKRASARPFRIRLDRPALSQILWRVEREGERLEKPPDSPREMYAIMRKCWACNPSDRPNFAQLATMVTEAKPAEVRAAREFAEARKLALAPGDIVTLVEHGLELSEWRGQNQRTLSVGWFPPGVVVPPVPAPSGEPAPDPVSDFISAPMRGSLHHAAHGDVRPDRSWGTPDNLEESSGGFRQATTREKEPSNLQKMSGFSRSLESVLSGRQCPGPPSASRGRAYPVVARSVVVQQDPRRFSEASLLPPPRPPPPHLKRSNWKPQRRPATVPPPQPPGGANLVKMSHLARSTPQLDEPADARERLREREIPPPPPLPPAHLTRDALISQVMDAVHGVTIEEARAALQRNDWNPPRAEQQLKASARKRRDFWGQFSQTPKRDEGPRRSVFDGAFVGTIFRKRPSVKVSLTAASLQLEQLYSLSLCSKEDCLRILARYQWNLQLASRYLIRWSRDDRSASAERRV
ncbi:non-receptor tyrosine-protein kinase TNK1 isoform X2 [Corythoichthys intestinalis]|uniref:non-receptor tyrosine-protein kinase TNK1 isoform X2 n=1 Tax=Corythoichthys intestinalis TaxID=161448 RepID=UPI0025A66969|nr:non-receptor tyrosine-protein kinase TNK1 isoform X2 [Corythoichthys intestinalis]